MRAPWALLERLDQFLLGPLAAIPRVLPVVAGRGQGYRWVSPEMQLRSEATEAQALHGGANSGSDQVAGFRR